MPETTDEFVARCFEQYSQQLFRHARQQWHCTVEEADDVTQEVFLSLYDTVEVKGVTVTDPRAWLYAALHHQLTNARKREEKRPKAIRGFYEAYTNEVQTVEQQYLGRERARAVKVALSKVSREDRRSVIAWARGVRLREIAAVRGMDLRRVHERILGLVAKLRRQVVEQRRSLRRRARFAARGAFRIPGLAPPACVVASAAVSRLCRCLTGGA